jgi:linoleoyl-CoA desaturase
MFDYKFIQTSDNDFQRKLQERVNDYFAKNKIVRKADKSMIWKTFFSMGFYVLVYVVILFGSISNIGVHFFFWGLLGLGQTFIGMCVMHDKVHGAYTKNKFASFLLEIPILLIGVESKIWCIEHNIIHHNYTNVNGIDQDINPRFFFRFSKDQPKRWFHRFQHIYATFLYGLMVIEWITWKDFLKVRKYYSMGLLKTGWETVWLTLQILVKKLVFFTVFLVIPLLVLPLPNYLIVIMFLTMVVVSGVTMTIIFQLAHVVPNVEFADVDRGEQVNWHLHQLRTTSNFAMNNKVITFFLGGLNFQIEHHLFPDVCHVHYQSLSKIVQHTAKECEYPYHFNDTFFNAVLNHYSMLKELGK